VHVLDRPEIGNTGDDDDASEVVLVKTEPVAEKKTEELSSVRITPKSSSQIKPAKVQVEQPAPAPVTVSGADTVLKQMNEQMKGNQSDAPACNVCGAIMMRSGACYKCNNCGNQGGCS